MTSRRTSISPAASTPPAGPVGAAGAGRVAIRVPGPLRELTGGAAEVGVDARTVAAALEALLARHPGLRRHLRDEAGSLRDHVNIFLNEEDIRFLDGSATHVQAGDIITVVPSIAGG